MGVDAYTAGRRYEALLTRAYPRKKVNSLKSLMDNAITMEQGHTYAKHLGTAEKQFQLVKSQIIETLEILSETAPYNSDPSFEVLQDALKVCKYTNCLMELVESALQRAILIEKEQ